MSELLEKMLSRDNMNATYKRVCANKGSGGIDGVSVDELKDYIIENWNGKGASRTEVTLNHRMPNGTYAGVRVESPYSI